MTRQNYSDENVEVFTLYPHHDQDIDAVCDLIRKKAARSESLFPNVETVITDIDLKGKLVLEIGCGAGIGLLQFGIKGSKVVGVDGSQAQIQRIRNHAERLGIKDGVFVHSRIESMEAPLRAAGISSVDFIMYKQVVHHVEGWRQSLAAAASVLKPWPA